MNAKKDLDWIKLNVGGRIFETFRMTLRNGVEDSLLGKMFDPLSRLSPAKVHDGAYLIDACPHKFAVVLDWLRYRQICLAGNEAADIIPLAEYFGLYRLKAELEKLVPEDVRPLPGAQEDEIVKISLAGLRGQKVYEVNKQTLTFVKGSKLARLFDKRYRKPRKMDAEAHDAVELKGVDICSFKWIYRWLESKRRGEEGFLRKDVPLLQRGGIHAAARSLGLWELSAKMSGLLEIDA